jgi:hypothetical protein
MQMYEILTPHTQFLEERLRQLRHKKRKVFKRALVKNRLPIKPLLKP